MRFLVLVCLAAAALAAPEPLQAQAARSGPRIDELMSADQFRRAGLTKLSQEELQQLNAWLVTFADAVLQAATPPPEQGATPAVIESRIDGEFTGWEGETIFKLLNGQIWQQSSYAYKYKYAYSPKVLIYKSGATYRMKVDGVDTEISVRRLK
jgi:hypothetical protein